MSLRKVLIANRGEIAIRIARAAAELDIESVAVFSEDDETSLHTKKADEAFALTASGPAAYLDGPQLIAAAVGTGCDALHPGYGFLSENAGFARDCEDAGVTFVGPSNDVLRVFGDKGQAKQLARRSGIPILEGTEGPTTLEAAREFFLSLAPGAAVMVKAVAGGGGRGMRAVSHIDELESAYQRCASEARTAFGDEDLYVEEFLQRARHIEVQVVGDGSGHVVHLWERECSIQRNNQKIVEVAPSPTLSPWLRERLTTSAVRLAEIVKYRSLGTIEFLIDADDADRRDEDVRYAFIEANPRLQVEHTVTEEVTDLDLVGLQLKIAGGSTLDDLGLIQHRIPEPRGFAIQVRVNLERMQPDGTARPSGGTLSTFEVPSGRGVRVDTFGYGGYQTSARFDSLLAKVIGYSGSSNYADCVRKTHRALCEMKVAGVDTNIPFLQAVLTHPDFVSNNVHTRFLQEHSEELARAAEAEQRKLFFVGPDQAEPLSLERGRAGAKVDASDPLAVLSYGKSSRPPGPAGALTTEILDGLHAMNAPLQGTVVSLEVGVDDEVVVGQQLLVMEAMKMEHVILADRSGVVRSLGVELGDAVFEGYLLMSIEPAEIESKGAATKEITDLDLIRPDLAEVQGRHSITLDILRPEAVESRRRTGQRTARENIDDLCDPDTFTEYGQLVIAAQRSKRSLQDLIERTPADGLISGIGSVNGELFGAEASQCVIVSYDYTVLAGTQGQHNHRKHDRAFQLAAEAQLPVIFFTEGGGGRAGDTDGRGTTGLRGTTTFQLWGKLSGLVPLVGVNSGRSFAGNAAILGGCDVIIATANSTIGMGGPAMIEGGGLGVFGPEEVGPMSVQVPNGVVDIAVGDEAEAVRVAKQYVSYFQGSLSDWTCADQRLLRHAIPDNRLRVYDIRQVIGTMADTGSVLELRREFGMGMITAFIRVEGRPLGIVANNPSHLAGAIDSDGADKAARFMQLCDAFDIPLLFLCDTPGIMVGPEAEKTALVRHASRLFVTGANMSVPFFTIVLRKSYGLGAMAMAGGTFGAPFFAVAWPTGEFGGMGLEGQVKLGFRNELAAIDDPIERLARYEELVAEAYERGKALNSATYFEVDDVIDPADSRRRISAGLRAHSSPSTRTGKKRPFVDTW